MAVTETVKIVFEADTGGVTDSINDLVKLKKITQEEADALKKLGEEAKKAGDGLDGLGDDAKKAGDGLGGLGDNAGDAGEKFVSLKARLREAKLEVQQLSESSNGKLTPALDAAIKKAGALADEMDDLNRAIKLSNPEGKAQAFVNFGNKITGAFQIATGALQAFGAENEEVQKIAMKLQGALNIAQGVASIKELKESYQDIKIVLGLTTAAQTTLTGATTAGAAATTGASAALRGFAASLSATGIGAIVVALGALVGAMILLGDETDETAKKSERLLEIEAERAKLAGDELAASRALKVLRGEITADAAKRLDAEDEINKQIAKTSDELAKVITNNKSIIDQYKIFAAQGREQEFFAGFTDEASDVVRQYLALQDNLVQLRKTAVTQLQVVDEQANQNKKKEDEKAEKERLSKIKEAEAKRLKAIQDAENAIKEELARQASLRGQFEKELQDQLAAIDEQGNIKKLKIANDYYDDEDQLKLQNLQTDVDIANEKLLKLEEFGKKETDAYTKQLQQRNILLKQITQIEKDIQEKKYNELLELSEYFYQEELLLNTKNIKDADKRNVADKKAYQKLLEDKLALAKVDTAERAKLERELLNLKADIANDEKTLNEKSSKERAETAKALFQETFDFILTLNRASFERQQQDLEQQKEKGIITEEQYQEKLKKIKQNQARQDKELAIFSATVAFAEALVKALTTKNPPAALILAAAVGGLNLAKIIATPLPKFKDGTLSVPGVDTGQDTVMAMLRPGEAVIPTETNREYAPALRAIYRRDINAKELNDFVTNRDQGAFAFNQVSLDALYRRDLKVSAITAAGKSAQLTAQPTKITADVDVQQLTRAMSKNKSVEVTNTAALGEAIAAQLSKRINPRQVI